MCYKKIGCLFQPISSEASDVFTLWVVRSFSVWYFSVLSAFFIRHPHSQVLTFGGTKHIFMGKYFVFIMCLKQTFIGTAKLGKQQNKLRLGILMVPNKLCQMDVSCSCWY